MNPQEVGVSVATDLQLVEPVKVYVGDAILPRLHGGGVAVVPGALLLVALSAFRLPLEEALAGYWNPFGCDQSSVLVVDSGVRLDVY